MSAPSPRTFLQALKGRYGAEDTTEYDEDAFLVSTNDSSQRGGGGGRPRIAKKWEMVGMEKTRQKQAQHSKLTAVTLKGESITAAQLEAGEIEREKLVRLQEVDISENPAVTWDILVEIAHELPAITSLQASDIPQLLPSAALNGTPSVLRPATLTKLILNNAGFSTLAQLSALVQLPGLNELHLDCNNISTLTLDESTVCFPTVHTLSLSHNKFASWDDSNLNACLPVAFPSLLRLFLADNEFPDIEYPAKEFRILQERERGAANETETETEVNAKAVIATWRSKYAFLTKLELLGVQENKQMTNKHTLDSIRELCPNITVTRVTYKYLFTASAPGSGQPAGALQLNETLARMLAVAALPTVTTLNRAQVRPKERYDSELYYVQRGLSALDAAGVGATVEVDGLTEEQREKRNGVLEEFPMLLALREKHKDVVVTIYREGNVGVAGMAAESGEGSSHFMIRVRLHCDGYDEHRRVLPSSVTVGALKALVRAVFAIDPANQQLSFRPGDDGVVMHGMPLNDEKTTLGAFGVTNDSIITVTNTSLR